MGVPVAKRDESKGLRRFATKTFGSIAAGLRGTARFEGDSNTAKAKFGNALDDRFAFDPSTVDERTVGRREIDQMPYRATPQERRVRAGNAVIGDSDIVLRAATNVNHGSFDRKSSSAQRAFAQDFHRGECAALGLGGPGLFQWRQYLESKLLFSNPDHVPLTKLL